MIKKINLWHILLASFILRIVLAPLVEHGDVINYYWWAKDLFEKGFLGFYDRSIANAMPPTYPPITSYIFYLSAAFHQLLWKIFWFLNLKIGIFPSNLIFWLESERGWYFVNKLPSILADLGIIYFVYLLVIKIKNKKSALLASLLVGFIPPFWYNSAVWGQTDSIFGFFMLGAFYFLFSNKSVLSGTFYLLSVLTKPTSLFALPVFLLYWFKKGKIKDYLLTLFFSSAIVFLLYLPFHPSGTLAWIIDFYKNSLGGELDYIVANTFNLWGLVHGFENVSEKALFLGIPSNIVGYGTFLVFLAWVIRVFFKSKDNSPSFILMLAVLLSFFAFLVLPRMHERYFYPTLLLLVPLASYDKNVRKVFYLVSFLHIINLYHFWWVPNIPVLINLLSASDRLLPRILGLVNFGAFLYFYKAFLRHKKALKI